MSVYAEWLIQACSEAAKGLDP